MKLVASLLAASLVVGPAPEPFQFALIGDLPYNAIETPLFRQLLSSLDALPLAFVVHVGDLKSSGSSCSDDLLSGRRALLDRSARPLVFLFGDNEWTDCHLGRFDPLERLARLRVLFASKPESLGRERMALERQPDGYPENVRWRTGGVQFVGLHVVGSGNNRGRTPEMDREYVARTAANVAWLAESFALARADEALGVVVAFQADPRFDLPAGSARRHGFDETLAALEKEVRAYPHPVALLHGDSHRYRVDHPLVDPATGSALERFTRVITFGSPYVRYVLVTIDPADPRLFRFEPGPERPGREPQGTAGSPADPPTARPRRRPTRARSTAGSTRC